MPYDYIKLAVKNLRHRQLRSLLTMIGIFIGIATVVSLIALGAGLKAAVAAQFASLGTDRLVIQAKGGDFGPPGQNTAVELTEKDLDVVQRSRYVEVATGRLLEPVEVEYNGDLGVEFMISLPEERDQRDLVLSIQNVRAASGRLPESGDGFRVAIGADLADAETTDNPLLLGDTITIQGKKVQIIGILTRRGTPQIDSAIMMSEDAMRELLGEPDKYSMLVAQVTSPEDMELAQQTIEKNLRSSRGVEERKEDFTVETPGSVIASFNTIIGGVTAVLVGIAAISLVVGGIGIMNTMYTAVLERTREIGIMKAVGATNNAILAIFLFESGLLGLTGGIIGVLLGWALSQLVIIAGSASLGPGILSAQLTPQLIFGALAFSFIVGAIAGTFPAYEASRMPPVEALRQ
jgi:putative ABC transport system permease protein